MNTDEISLKIAEAIRKSYFNAGEYSGISADGEKQIALEIRNLVEAIKKEVLEETQRSLQEREFKLQMFRKNPYK